MTTDSAVTPVVPTGTWNVDPSHSTIGFAVNHMGIATVRGAFAEFEGSLVVGDDGVATASGTVKAASVDTKEAARDEHLRSADFFDAETHRDIEFQSTSITPTGDDEFEITGDLTLHGITKPVTLKAEVTGSDVDPWGNTRVGLEITGSLSRGDFEMKFNQALGSGNMLVADKVKLDLDISAVKA